MDLGIKDKVAIVTGGSRGIGRATAEVLAEEGAKVVICGRNVDDLEAARSAIAATGADVMAVPCDISKQDSIDNLVARTIERYGTVHILVNNGAPLGWGPLLSEVSDEEWMTRWETKFLGYVRCSRAVLPYMRKQKWGRIVHVVGMGGRGPNKRYLVGGAIHFALLNLTKGMADEYGPDGILVTAVSPGPIETGHHPAILRVQAAEAGVDFETAKAGFINGVPLRRYGTPRETADAIVFLASERGSFISGSELLVDGARARGI